MCESDAIVIEGNVNDKEKQQNKKKQKHENIFVLC